MRNSTLSVASIMTILYNLADLDMRHVGLWYLLSLLYEHCFCGCVKPSHAPFRSQARKPHTAPTQYSRRSTHAHGGGQARRILQVMSFLGLHSVIERLDTAAITAAATAAASAQQTVLESTG